MGFTIDGGVAFWGSVHESGFLGHDYTFAMAVYNYRDASGNLIVFVHSGSVEGTDRGVTSAPKRDDSWNGNASMDPFVSNNWDSIKSSGWHASLNVDTDPGQVIAAVVDGAVLAGALVSAAAFVIAGIAGGGYTVERGTDSSGNPTLVIYPKQPQQ